MFSYLLLSIKRRWAIFLLIIIMLTFVSLGYGSTRIVQNGIVMQTREDLEQNWRWQYDILVYPNEGQVYQGLGDGWVAPQTPLASYGGISFEDLEIIKQIPGVEVAAPISLLGYVEYDRAQAIYKDTETGVYYAEHTSKMFDGLQWHNAFHSNRFIENFTSYSERKYIMDSWEEYETEDGKIINVGGSQNGLQIDFRKPNQLLFVAIDPEAEDRLFALSDAVVDGDNLRLAEIIVNNADHRPDSLTLPVIALLDQGLQVEEKISLARVDVPETIDESDLTAGVIPYLLTRPQTHINELTLYPYQPDWRYQRLNLRFDENGVEEQNYIYGFGMQEVYWYSPISIDVLIDSSARIPLLQAKAKKESSYHELYGETEPMLKYRDILNSWDIFSPEPLIFGMQIIGYYDASRLVSQYSNSWKPGDPVDLYTPHHSMILADGAGNAVDPRPQVPLPYKDTYYTGGPEALTLLTPEVTKIFYGDEPPISSIRVIVKGVEERNELSQKKIEQVALEIMEKTGHQVDIMLGSAPSKVHIELAGKEAGEIGLVEEAWTQKGVSWSIEDQVVSTNQWLFIYLLLIIFFLTYTVVNHSLLKRSIEFARLRAIGWTRNKIIGGLSLEVLSLTLLSLVPLLLTMPWWSTSLSYGDVALVGGINGIIIAIGYYSGSRRSLWLSPRAGLAGESVNSGEKRSIPIRGLISFVWHQLFRRPLRFGLMVITVLLSTWMVILFVATQQSLSDFLFLSFLGETIDLNLQTYQRVFLGLGLSLTLAVVLLLLILNMIERQKEFYVMRAIGWPWQRLRRYLLIEAGIIGGLGGLLGSVVAYGVLTFFSTLWLPRWVAIVAIFLPMILMILVTYGVIIFFSRRSHKRQGYVHE